MTRVTRFITWALTRVSTHVITLQGVHTPHGVRRCHLKGALQPCTPHGPSRSFPRKFGASQTEYKNGRIFPNYGHKLPNL